MCLSVAHQVYLPNQLIALTRAQQRVYNVIGVTDTAGATIRYTLDGSRPSQTSPVLDPEAGIDLPWPGPALVVNMR